MPRSGKNNERTEQVPQGERKLTKVEPLRPQAEHPDKLYNDLAKFPSENPYPVLRIHKDGTVLYANKASEPILKAQNSDIGLPAPPEWRDLVKNALSSGQVVRDETAFNERVFAFQVVPIAESNYVNFYGTDVTEQKIAHEEREITIKLLSLINSKNQVHDLMKLTTILLRDWSGCEAVGIRLQEGEDFPYFETNGFPDEFVRAESKLCSLNELGEPVRDGQGRAYLECMCGNIISGRFDPTKPFFTKHGSFWTNSTTALLASTTGADRMAKTRNRCNTAGYESVALVPLRTGKETFGLLQFNSKQKDRFTPEKISLLEQLADNLAIGLAQRKAEESLRESEEHYRSLFDNMMEGCAYCQMIFAEGRPKDLLYLAVNSVFEKLTGLKNVVGRKISEVIPGIKETNPELLEIYGRVALTGKPEKFEDYFEPLKAWLSISAYSPEKGYFVAVFENITERKKSEEALRLSEDRLRRFYESGLLGVIYWNINGTITGANDKFMEMVGYTREELTTGKIDWAKMTPSEYRHLDDNSVAELKATGVNKKPFEKEYIRKDGTRIPIIIAGAMLDEARFNGVAFVLDITERKKSEETILRLNKILTMIADISQHILQTQDKDLLLKKICEVIVSQAYRMAWMGFCDEDNKKIIPQAQAGFEEGYLASIKVTFDDTEYGMGPSGMAVKTAKPNIMRFIATDPRFEPWRTEATKRGYRSSAAIPLFTGNKVFGVLNVYADTEDAFGQEEVRLLEGLANDISTGLRGIDEQTKRYQAEQKLLDYQKHLKRLAARLMLAEEGERRRIAGEIHDEISQTLAMAKIKLDTLRNSPPSEASSAMIEEISSSVEKVIQETRTLTFELSNPILYELGFEAAVAEWLNENVQEKHGIATEFHDDELPKPLEDDLKVMLFRNIRELLTNCIKHAKAGRIMVGLRRIDDSIEVTVEDDGIGFDPAQVRATASKKGKLGLFSIRENTENTGGSFEIESKPGAGCKAIMTAPLKNKSNKKEV